jgi:hypothetical protein
MTKEKYWKKRGGLGLLHDLPEEEKRILNSLVLFKTIKEHAFVHAQNIEVFKVTHLLLVLRSKPLVSFVGRILRKVLSKSEKLPIKDSELKRFEKILESFLEKNLLVSKDEVVNNIKEALSSQNSNLEIEENLKHLDYICVSTKGRPETLKQFMKECEKIKKDERFPTIIISDASESSVAEENKENIQQFKDKFNIRYISNEIRSRGVSILAKNIGCSEEALKYGLLEYNNYYSGGTAKNYLLLATAGSNIAYFDDDVKVSDLRKGFSKQEAIAVGNQDIFNRKSFEQLSEISSSSEKTTIELYQEHLGNYLSDEIKTGDIDTETFTGSMENLIKNNESTVDLVSFGHFGHSAMWSQDAFLRKKIDENHPSKLSDDRYNEYLQSEFCSIYTNQKTITDSNFFLSLNFALNNKKMSPFFEPIGRSEDGVFINLFQITNKNSYYCMLPEIISHIRPESFDKIFDVTTRFSIDNLTNLIIGKAISEEVVSEMTQEEIYKKIGNYMIELGDSNIKKFSDVVSEAYNSLFLSLLYEIDLSIYAHKGSSSWKRDMIKANESLLNHKKKEGGFKYYDQKRCHTHSEIRNMLTQFGSFAKIWPKAWNHSKEITSELSEEII